MASLALFRAVSDAERRDIVDFGFRQHPDGKSLEAKLFATSLRDAAAFGRDFFRIDREPFTIVEVTIPLALASRLDTVEMDRRQVVAVQPPMLDEFNATAKGNALTAVPVE